MCQTLGPISKRRILEKRRWPVEVQNAIDDFESEFGSLTGQMRDRLADAVINRDITETGDINAAVRRVISEDRDELRVVLQEGARNGADAGQRMASRRFDLDIDFGTLPESTLEELEEFVDSISDDVLETIGDGVGTTLEDAFEEGLDRDAVADIMREGLDNELGEAAAQRHARTLVQGASESGNHAAIEQSSAIGEQWIATAGQRTRDTHDMADGQIVPIDGTFVVGGSELQHPGDPQGPIEEIANCRCSMRPVFEDELSEDEINELRAGNRLRV